MTTNVDNDATTTMLLQECMEYFQDGDIGVANFAIEKLKGLLYFVNDGNAFMYDSDQRLWISRSVESTAKKVGEFLLNVAKDALLHAEDGTAERRVIEKVKMRVGSRSGSIAITKLIVTDDQMLQNNNHSASYLLPILNGKVVDLKTGRVFDRMKDHYFSFECPVSMGNPNDQDVLRFFFSLMCNRQDYVSHLQKVLGCFLIGVDVRHFFIFWGIGRNGKSTLFNLLRLILKNYCIGASSSVMIASRSRQTAGGATPHLMRLIDARLATVSETEAGDRLNVGFLKAVTGGDAMPIRALHRGHGHGTGNRFAAPQAPFQAGVPARRP